MKRVAFFLLACTPLLGFAEDPSSQFTPQKQPTKKVRAHFVGVRRPPEKKHKRPSTKIRNPWVTSITHPKNKEKTAKKLQEQENPPEEDLPFFFEESNL